MPMPMMLWKIEFFLHIFQDGFDKDNDGRERMLTLHEAKV